MHYDRSLALIKKTGVAWIVGINVCYKCIASHGITTFYHLNIAEKHTYKVQKIFWSMNPTYFSKRIIHTQPMPAYYLLMLTKT